ncbi:MAG: subtilisin family serine protease [Gammaproteobacteria bacterium]|jgi:subtilisin family serine protease
MNLNRISTLLVLLYVVIVSASAVAVGTDESVNTDQLDLESIASNPKLSNDTQMLSAFESGSVTISVVFSLRHSVAAQELSALSLEMSGVQSNVKTSASSEVNGPYYNLSNPDIRTKLARSVKTELDSFRVGIEGYSAASVSANNSSAIAPITVTNQFTYSFGIAANVTLAGLEYLLQSDKVILIEENLILTQHLTQGISVMNGTTTRNTYKGAGVAVAIVDTGIDDSHPDLDGGKVLGGYDFGDDDTNFRPTSNGSSHGTSVGGIVAGDVNTVGDYIGGVAPNAKLYGLKISPGDTGSASSADMVDAWEWAITHQNDDPNNPILVVNTSFGGGRYTSSCNATDSSMTQAALNGVNAGMTHFVSSGNDGYCDAMGWPACITHVNSVGAVYDANIGNPGNCVSTLSCLDTTPNASCPAGTEAYFPGSTTSDQVTGYSNSDTNLTIFAPSNNAYTATIVGTGNSVNNNYTTGFGGTSAAAPYSAGAAAVLQSAAKAKMGRFLSPAEVQQYFVTNGQSITDSKASLTKPRVDLGAAVLALPTTIWDLVVESPSVSDNSVTTGQSFDINATVRNQGTETAASTTLRYYRSDDEVISTADTFLASDEVPSLDGGATSAQSESASINAIDTYWVGACVDAVADESSTSNQCSTGVQVIVSAPALTLSIVAGLISETDGSTTATVTRNTDTTATLTVDLVSDDTSEATVPAAVTIAAGETTSEPFNIAAVDDAFVDGNQTVTVTASATGFAVGTDTLAVIDTDTAAITLVITADSVSEGDGPVATTATVSRNSNTTLALTVTLSSDDTTEATVPASVTIEAGQTTSPAFSLNAVNDSIVDDTQNVTITASATEHAAGTDTLDVTDDDTAVLTLSIVTASVSEGAGEAATTATVSRNSNTLAALFVSLSSNDTTEATIPASVTIEAGQTTSPAFNLNAVNDSIVDGTQNVTISASAREHADGTDTLDVTDDDTAGLTLSIVAASVSEGAGATAATVSRNSNTTSALTVTLSSDDITEATVPSSVAIAAGANVSAAFNITVVDDVIVDGTQNVTITASAAEHAAGTDTLDVTDDDDDDHDGVENLEDNCQFDANPDQLNSDTDFLGDACDGDDDNDSLLDDDDNCPLVANFDQLDANDNGVGDVCELEVDDLCIVIKSTNGGVSVVCL